MATWNVRSLYRPGAVRILTDELQQAGVVIAAVQETRFTKDTPSFDSNGYKIYCSSNNAHHVLGTAFLVAHRWNHLVINFSPMNDRLCILRIKGRFFNYSLLNAHAPTNDTSDDIKEEFYEALRRAYDNCPNHDVKILLGDMNAKVGREESYRPTIGRWSLHEETNENGLRLIDFATEKGMVVRSSYFMHKRIHQATWVSPDGVTRNQIDHCLVDGRHFSDVINVKVRRGANVDSDHFLVVVDVRARIDRAQTARAQATKRFAANKLKDPSVRTAFAQNISAGINELRTQHPEPENLTECWQHLSQVIRTGAEHILGHEAPTDRKTWFDNECAQATAAKNQARIRNLERPTRSANEHYRILRRVEKRIHKKKKREFQNRTLSELENNYNRNEARKFYKVLNTQRKGFNPRVNMCRALDGTLLTNKTDVLARWREHFDALLNEDIVETGAESSFNLEVSDTATVPPTRQETVDAINSLKNNKAAGLDGIQAELLKIESEELIDAMHEIVLKIWSTETLPDEWLEAALFPIHKKGDKLACENYRGISVLPAAYKVFAKILYNRLSPHAETVIGEYQCGFRRDRSTTDQIFNVRLILQKGREFKVHTYHLFIDFKSAYDKIKRSELFVVMRDLGFEPKLIRLVAMTLNGSRCRIKMGNEVSDVFVTKEGLRQGDALSTLLFNVALEGAMRRAGIQTSRTLATGSVQILGFADDLDIVGRRHTDVVDTYTSLKTEALRLGLIINENKTKYMKTNEATVPQQEANIVSIGGQRFEVVDQFVYLGALIRADNDSSLEIKRRIMAANRCVHGLQRHLRSNLLTRNTKFCIYKTLIRPVLLYGSETWPTTKSDEQLLLSFERKVLRIICGATHEGDRWRRKYNFELEREYGEPNIVANVKVNRLRWAGHLARMDQSRAPATLFRNDPDGRRGVGRPKARWIDNVEADIRALRIRNWKEKAQNRDLWRTILDQAKTNKWL